MPSYRRSDTRREVVRPYGLEIAVAVLIALVVIVAIVFAVMLSNQPMLVSSDSPTASLSASDNTESAQQGSSQTYSGKLSGATEETDANGIVHGTSSSGVNYMLWGRGEQALSADKVSLCAAGDQVSSDMLLALAETYGAASGEGTYDYSPFYKEVAPFIANYDLKYINQETAMATSVSSAVTGYPSFNSPDECAHVISEVGFNLVGMASNHTLDVGTEGAQATLDVWESYPQQIVAGSYRSEEDREIVRLIERNGIVFAFMAFCYGDNHYGTDLPDTWNLCGFDKDLMKADIERAQQVADVVIVAMHWGTEYTTQPDTQQLEYAQYLADLNVDLVLGSHAHSMQPTRYVTGSSGKVVPVVYGLSDFVSGWTITDTIISGLFTCDFVKVADEGETSWHVELQNLLWYPTIEWSDGGDVYVRFVNDMDKTTCNENTRTEDVEDSYTYIRQFIADMGMEIDVELSDMPSSTE